jgi:hypothetical protein
MTRPTAFSTSAAHRAAGLHRQRVQRHPDAPSHGAGFPGLADRPTALHHLLRTFDAVLQAEAACDLHRHGRDPPGELAGRAELFSGLGPVLAFHAPGHPVHGLEHLVLCLLPEQPRSRGRGQPEHLDDRDRACACRAPGRLHKADLAPGRSCGLGRRRGRRLRGDAVLRGPKTRRDVGQLARVLDIASSVCVAQRLHHVVVARHVTSSNTC